MHVLDRSSGRVGGFPQRAVVVSSISSRSPPSFGWRPTRGVDLVERAKRPLEKVGPLWCECGCAATTLPRPPVVFPCSWAGSEQNPQRGFWGHDQIENELQSADCNEESNERAPSLEENGTQDGTSRLDSATDVELAQEFAARRVGQEPGMARAGKAENDGQSVDLAASTEYIYVKPTCRLPSGETKGGPDLAPGQSTTRGFFAAPTNPLRQQHSALDEQVAVFPNKSLDASNLALRFEFCADAPNREAAHGTIIKASWRRGQVH